ncbi:MAG: TonB-dependent receptor [Acidobacteria bacterium]|nr:TonB-dependent receptor [Acidobacteriota bacterium]
MTPKVLACAVVAVLTYVPAYAQLGGAANVGGTVVDESGGALPGVTVTVANTATGRSQTLVTGDDGRYRAVALVPGPYEVTAELQGFATVRRAITLVVGAEAELSFTLGVASIAETVTVVGEAPLVEVARSQPSSVITGTQLEALPVLSRNFLVLAQLLPGAAPISRTPSTLPRNGVTKFGAVPDQRYAFTTQIDGGDVDDAIWGLPTINLSQDAIAEFKVYRNQFDAQYGKATTAVVSVVTKSGTNRMSGSGYYFGRDRGLNATNAFATDKPPFSQTRIGYSLGGPVSQNRTHHFSAYEGLFVNTADIVALPPTNPFAAQENGTYDKRVRRRNFDARVDHRFNDSHNMYVRYAYDFYGDYAPDKGMRVLDRGLLTLPPTGLSDFSRSYSTVAEENWILSGRAVNTLRAHVLIHRLYAEPTFYGQGVQRPSFTGLGAGWGQQQQSPQRFPRERLTISEALLITRGKHDLNIGGELTKGHYGFDAHHNEGGLWFFTTDTPFERNNPATYPTQFTIRASSNTLGILEHRATQIAAYISDTYRVHPRWTLNLGLRWDFDTNLRDNHVINRMLDDSQFAGIENFVSRDRGNQYDAFQPRVGATWDVRGDGTLVARGGYGIYVTRNRQWFSVSSQHANFGASQLVTDRALLGQCYPSIECVLAGAGSGLRTVQLITDDFAFPYQRTATAGVGWQVTSSTSLDVDVVHSYLPNAWGGDDANLPASGAISVSNPRPVRTLGRVIMVGPPITKSWYDALEMQVRQRVRGGNSLQVSYTLSRAMMDGVTRETTLRSFQRASLETLRRTGRSFEYGYNPTDTRHNLAVSASFELPLGFQVSGIARVISAEPLSVTTGLDLDGDAITLDRPLGLPPTVGRGNLREQLEIINTYRATLNLAPFTMDRIKVQAPAKHIDIRLTRRVNIGQARMELFAEAFNLTNFVNVYGANGNIRLASFNAPTGALDARQIQWGARYAF